MMPGWPESYSGKVVLVNHDNTIAILFEEQDKLIPSIKIEFCTKVVFFY